MDELAILDAPEDFERALLAETDSLSLGSPEFSAPPSLSRGSTRTGHIFRRASSPAWPTPSSDRPTPQLSRYGDVHPVPFSLAFEDVQHQPQPVMAHQGLAPAAVAVGAPHEGQVASLPAFRNDYTEHVDDFRHRLLDTARGLDEAHWGALTQQGRARLKESFVSCLASPGLRRRWGGFFDHGIPADIANKLLGTTDHNGVDYGRIADGEVQHINGRAAGPGDVPPAQLGLSMRQLLELFVREERSKAGASQELAQAQQALRLGTLKESLPALKLAAERQGIDCSAAFYIDTIVDKLSMQQVPVGGMGDAAPQGHDPSLHQRVKSARRAREKAGGADTWDLFARDCTEAEADILTDLSKMSGTPWAEAFKARELQGAAGAAATQAALPRRRTAQKAMAPVGYQDQWQIAALGPMALHPSYWQEQQQAADGGGQYDQLIAATTMARAAESPLETRITQLELRDEEKGRQIGQINKKMGVMADDQRRLAEAQQLADKKAEGRHREMMQEIKSLSGGSPQLPGSGGKGASFGGGGGAPKGADGKEAVQGTNGNLRVEMKCWSCNRYGHVSRFCPSKNRMGKLEPAQQAVICQCMAAVYTEQVEQVATPAGLDIMEQWGGMEPLKAWVMEGSGQGEAAQQTWALGNPGAMQVDSAAQGRGSPR